MSGAHRSSPAGLVIRAAEVADARPLQEVRIRGWRETYAHLLSVERLASLDVDRAAENTRRMMEEGRYSALVAELDGRIVGIGAAGAAHDAEPPRPLELYMLYVDRAAQGTGVADALLTACLGDAPASLWVADPNPRAQGFYRRHGFAPDGERATIAEWEDMPEIRMVR